MVLVFDGKGGRDWGLGTGEEEETIPVSGLKPQYLDMEKEKICRVAEC